MSYISITSLTGYSPYDITICDKTLSYCQVVLTGVVSVPPVLTIQVPEFFGTPLDNEVVVIVTDSKGCEEILYLPCSITPTPTPTPTTTPTLTQTPSNCQCIQFINQSPIRTVTLVQTIC